MKTKITQKEFYALCLMPVGWHFKWHGDECFIDNRGVLILHDTYDGGWIHSRYETMQTEYALMHRGDIKPLRLKDWCWNTYSDEINPYFPKDKHKAFDQMLEIAEEYADKESPQSIKTEFDECWTKALVGEDA